VRCESFVVTLLFGHVGRWRGQQRLQVHGHRGRHGKKIGGTWFWGYGPANEGLGAFPNLFGVCGLLSPPPMQMMNVRRSGIVNGERSQSGSVRGFGPIARHPAQLSAMLWCDERPSDGRRVAQLPQPLVSDRFQNLSDMRVPLEHLVQVFDRQCEQTAVGVRANACHSLRLRQQADFYNTTNFVAKTIPS